MHAGPYPTSGGWYQTLRGMPKALRVDPTSCRGRQHGTSRRTDQRALGGPVARGGGGSRHRGDKQLRLRGAPWGGDGRST
eukprot:1824957-Alexandrium_andersonii.AAC.1